MEEWKVRQKSGQVEGGSGRLGRVRRIQRQELRVKDKDGSLPEWRNFRVMFCGPDILPKMWALLTPSAESRQDPPARLRMRACSTRKQLGNLPGKWGKQKLKVNN